MTLGSVSSNFENSNRSTNNDAAQAQAADSHSNVGGSNLTSAQPPIAWTCTYLLVIYHFLHPRSPSIHKGNSPPNTPSSLVRLANTTHYYSHTTWPRLCSSHQHQPPTLCSPNPTGPCANFACCASLNQHPFRTRAHSLLACAFLGVHAQGPGANSSHVSP